VLAAGVTIVGVMTALSQSATAASVASVASQFTSVANSASLTTPVVAQGTVMDRSGALVSKGTVVLLAWPSDESDVPVGHTVALTPIGLATSTSSGFYALRVDPAADLSGVTAGNGTISAEIDAYSGTTLVGTDGITIPAGAASSSTAASSAPIEDPGAASSGASAGPDETVDPTTIASGGAPNSTGPIENVAPESATESTIASAADPVAAQKVDLGGTLDSTPAVTSPDSDGPSPPPPGCDATKGASLGVHYGIVGQTYSQTTGVKHTFTYTSGATTSIGIGVQGSSGGGNFFSSGTRSIASTVTEYFPTYGNHTYRYYKTGWNFYLWHVKCLTNGKSHTEIRPGSFAGGAVTAAAGAPSAHKCVKQTAGSRYVQSKSHAITWSNGVSFGYGGVGVNLSTETGYSSSAEVSYSFSSSRYLCGSGSTPGGTPYVLSAKSTNS
jgi:hypothetical protein